MRVSVIVSTYNQPAWLEKVLVGYAAQVDRDFELLVADDGSGPETADLVRGVAAGVDFPLRHVWHEDRGYRRSIVLNRAVVAAEGDYLVFSDGDCVPRDDFVATHRRLATPGRFLSGGSVPLTMELSRALTLEDVRTGRFARASWLRSRGLELGRRALRLLPPGPLPALLDAVTPTGATFNLNNASLAKELVVEANGFEAEMKYGGADRAFGERLANMGVGGRQARHRAVLLHLDHPRPYKTRESIEHNRGVRRRIRERREVRAVDGIAELGPPEGAPRGGGG